MSNTSEEKGIAGSLNELLAECHEDYVGLWAILSDLEEDYPDWAASQRRQMALVVVRQLLEAGMLAGQFGPGQTFEVWRVSTDEALERIERAWDDLGREPTLGEICWFTAPPVE